MFTINMKHACNPFAKKMMTFAIVFMICLFSSLSAYSVVPVVKNLQKDVIFNIIDIKYKLEYPGTGSVNISFKGSNDGGKNFNLIPKSIDGDIGNVFPGEHYKHALWNIKADYPALTPSLVEIRLTANDGDHNIRYITRGGEDMVLIPGGSFQMGSTPNGMSIFSDESPEHEVSVDSFYMDVHEVTVEQYNNFLDATGHSHPLYWNDPRFNAYNQPVVGVTWEDAVAYCNWIGKRLPTEAEWERAARGGINNREFPWGNALDRNYGNFTGVEENDTWEDTAPVCKFLPNDYGLFDIIGNVYEWCSDYYDFSYYMESPNNNPAGPSVGESKVLRGGSCYDGFYPTYLRTATRFSYFPTTADGIVGFRCVWDVPK